MAYLRHTVCGMNLSFYQPFLGLSSDNPPNLAVVVLVLCHLLVTLSSGFLAISLLFICVHLIRFYHLANYASLSSSFSS